MTTNKYVPFAKSFSGHETFALRHFWLKKAVDQLSLDPELFHSEDAVVHLGVGKNMVRSIRHWALATRIAEEETGSQGKRLHASVLGRRLLQDGGWDPFLEDQASLWLLHWNLASIGTRAATWYLLFNRLLEYSFDRQALLEHLDKCLARLGWNSINPSTLKRDVECFIHTYRVSSRGRTSIEDIECPLSNLRMLIQEPSGEHLRFAFGPKPLLAPTIFAYALADFWNTILVERSTLDFRQIMFMEGSPALVFKLDQDTVLDYLDRIEDCSNGAMTFEDTALVRHVVKSHDGPLDNNALLEAYYE